MESMQLPIRAATCQLLTCSIANRSERWLGAEELCYGRGGWRQMRVGKRRRWLKACDRAPLMLFCACREANERRKATQAGFPGSIGRQRAPRQGWRFWWYCDEGILHMNLFKGLYNTD